MAAWRLYEIGPRDLLGPGTDWAQFHGVAKQKKIQAEPLAYLLVTSQSFNLHVYFGW